MESIIVLFWFSPDLSIPIFVNLDVIVLARQQTGQSSTYVWLAGAFSKIKWDDDLFTTRIADVTGFFLRCCPAVAGGIRW